MYVHQLTKTQAIAAARWFIVDFHENIPDVDGITTNVLIDQFVRDLSASIQHDVHTDDVVELLESLDQLQDLYFRTQEYTGISDFDAIVIAEHTTNVFTDDLNRMFASYSPRAARYFEAA